MPIETKELLRGPKLAGMNCPRDRHYGVGVHKREAGEVGRLKAQSYTPYHWWWAHITWASVVHGAIKHLQHWCVCVCAMAQLAAHALKGALVVSKC